MKPKAFFLPAMEGQRFCLLHSAHGHKLRGLVVYIHPFAEEMNKSRRMAALQARALAQSGYMVLQMDLLGCGDSSGDFGDAQWLSWVSDVVLASHWLRAYCDARGANSNDAPLWLWGLRAGCLLCTQAAVHLSEACNFLFWQPPTSGKTLLRQFLRLKLASNLLTGQNKGVMDGMHCQLANGQSVEVAGYMLTPALASGLEKSVLTPPANGANNRRLQWMEVSGATAPIHGTKSLMQMGQWQDAGYSVNSHIAQGPAFWQSNEIEESTTLLTTTTLSLSLP